MNPLHDPVARRCGFRCEYCLAREELFNFAFEVEHIVPRADGGSGEMSNLALACPPCNRYKGVRRAGRDDVSPLFNPRTDRWADHFLLDADRGEIIGLTPTGRVTVALLGMNDPRAVAARLIWIELQKYP